MRVHATEQQADDRLRELGIDGDALDVVLRAARAAFAAHTAFDPPSLPNTNLWGRATRVLREYLVPTGWVVDNLENQPRTVREDGEVAVVVSTGDRNTGVRDSQPTTRNPKGDATARKVELNRSQAALFTREEVGGSAGTATWLLLLYADDQEIRGELSLPDGIDPAGWITSWSERILLRSIGRDGVVVGADDGPSEPPGPDVVVIPRRG